MRLSLENSAYPQFLHHILENIQSPYVGFCYDSGHENAFHPEENFLNKYGDRLFAMHLQDNHGERDEHLIPFDGSIRWDKIIMGLKSSAIFREQLIFEPIAHGEGLYDYLNQAYRAVLKLAHL